MNYGIGVPHIISDPSKGTESSKKVMDGIIHSAMLTGFQRRAIDGIIESGIPGSSAKSKKSEPMTSKVTASKTPQTIGARHFPGSGYA